MSKMKEMVDRFLNWPLPRSVCSDPCASTPNYPHRTGTTLLTATEAEQMLEYVVGPFLGAEVPKIGEKTPGAVVRDLTEKLGTLRTIVAVGIHTDGSASVWQSETPNEIERASVVLTRFAIDAQGGYDQE